VREEFHFCLKLGGLYSLLQGLVHVSEFRDILKDLMLNPNVFGTSGFKGVSQIYYTKTSSRFVLLRFSPKMET